MARGHILTVMLAELFSWQIQTNLAASLCEVLMLLPSNLTIIRLAS